MTARRRTTPPCRRVGPSMQAAVTLVSQHPGCTKMFVAARISPHPQPWRNWALGYNPINRAIRAGLIIAHRTGRTYRLTVPEGA